MPLTKITADTLNDGAVTTVKIADANVTTAKIADANVTPAKLSQPLTQGTAQATTSGTSKDFTGIPSWAKKITISFNGVSTSGTSALLVQLGSTTIATSGYASTSVTAAAAGNTVGTSTAGFIMQAASASAVHSGHMVLTNVSGNIWASSHVDAPLTTNVTTGAGAVTLSGVLDRLRVTTVNGTDTFDAGSVNILYEG